MVLAISAAVGFLLGSTISYFRGSSQAGRVQDGLAVAAISVIVTAMVH